MRSGLGKFRYNLPALFWFSLLLIVLWQTLLVAYTSWHSKDFAQSIDDSPAAAMPEQPSN